MGWSFLFLSIFVTPVKADETHSALVIGNGTYTFAPLSNPPNDADLMAERLRALKFTVTHRKNLTQNEMKELIRDFGKTLKKHREAVGVFYYSGHGMQVEGRNYMIPIGVEIEDESDVSIYGVGIDTVLASMKFSGNNMNFIVLDACRNNPFEKSFKSPTKGLARMNAPKGSLIAFATEPHKVARQGRGRYSLFTKALSEELLKVGLGVEKMFKNVRVAVHDQTGGKQLPTTESRLLADFIFHPAQNLAQQPSLAVPPSTLKEQNDIAKLFSEGVPLFDKLLRESDQELPEHAKELKKRCSTEYVEWFEVTLTGNLCIWEFGADYEKFKKVIPQSYLAQSLNFLSLGDIKKTWDGHAVVAKKDLASSYCRHFGLRLFTPEELKIAQEEASGGYWNSYNAFWTTEGITDTTPDNPYDGHQKKKPEEITYANVVCGKDAL